MSDTLMAPVWFGVNLLLVRAAWVMSRELFPRDTGLTRVLHTILLCWACITGLGSLLGTLGILSGPALLAGVTALALPMIFKKSRSAIVGLCSRHWFSAPCASTSPGPVAPGPRLPAAEDELAAVRPSEWSRRIEAIWLVVWCAVLAFWVGRVIMGALLELPTDWDSLMYHIPLVDHFLRERSLYTPECGVWYNPSNNELFGVWLVAPFSGDYLIALNNLPAGVVFVLSTLGLSRLMGVRGSLGHLTALAALANFAVVRQLLDACNDVPVASFFLAALFYGLRYARANHFPDLLFASVSLGLCAGIKYFALGYAGVAGVTVLLAALSLRGPRSAARVAVIGVLGALLWGGSWYVRNALVTGLPLYPKGMTLDKDPLSEMYPDPWRSTFLGSGRAELLPLLEKAIWEFTGPCQYVAFLVLPASAIWLVGTGLWLRRRGGTITAGTFRLLLCFAAAGTGLVLSVTPFAVETLPDSLNMLKGGYSPLRFGLCFYSLTLLALAVLLHDISQGLHSWIAARRLVDSSKAAPLSQAIRLSAETAAHLPLALFAGTVLFQCATVFQRKLPGDLLTSVLFGCNLLLAGGILRLCWSSWPRLRNAIAITLSLAGACGMGWAVAFLGPRWHEGFTRHYDHMFHTRMYSELARMDTQTTRICALTYRYYPFFGSRRQYHVCQPKQVPDIPSLVEYLRAHDLNLVVVLNSDPFENGFYRGRIDWVRNNPRVFTPLQGDRAFTLFRVNPGLFEEAADLSPSGPSRH